jgi:hypothetical protein
VNLVGRGSVGDWKRPAGVVEVCPLGGPTLSADQQIHKFVPLIRNCTDNQPLNHVDRESHHIPAVDRGPPATTRPPPAAPLSSASII